MLLSCWWKVCILYPQCWPYTAQMNVVLKNIFKNIFALVLFFLFLWFFFYIVEQTIIEDRSDHKTSLTGKLLIYHLEMLIMRHQEFMRVPNGTCLGFFTVLQLCICNDYKMTMWPYCGLEKHRGVEYAVMASACRQKIPLLRHTPISHTALTWHQDQDKHQSHKNSTNQNILNRSRSESTGQTICLVHSTYSLL